MADYMEEDEDVIDEVVDDDAATEDMEELPSQETQDAEDLDEVRNSASHLHARLGYCYIAELG